MKIRLSLLTAALAFTVSTLNSSAAVSLVIDKATQTLTFAATDNGLSLDITGIGIVEVLTFQFQAGSGTNESIAIGSAFTESFNDQANLTVYDGNLDDGMRLVFSNTGAPADQITSLTANSTPISYAGLTTPYITILESFGSGSLLLDQGTGFTDIEFITVPEPGVFSFFAGAVALLGFARRR